MSSCDLHHPVVYRYKASTYSHRFLSTVASKYTVSYDRNLLMISDILLLCTSGSGLFGFPPWAECKLSWAELREASVKDTAKVELSLASALLTVKKQSKAKQTKPNKAKKRGGLFFLRKCVIREDSWTTFTSKISQQHVLQNFFTLMYFSVMECV